MDEKVKKDAMDWVSTMDMAIQRADTAILGAIEAVAEVQSVGVDAVKAVGVFPPAAADAFDEAATTQSRLALTLTSWARFHEKMHDLLNRLGLPAPQRGGGGGGKNDPPPPPPGS